MPSNNNNIIGKLRRRYEPHMQLSAKVDLNHTIIHEVEKKLSDLPNIHKTLSKSFAMQRKTLARVLGLEGRLIELEAQQAAEEQAKEGIDDLLGDILGEDSQEDQQEEVGDTKPKAKTKPKKKKPAAKKKKRPATPVGKKIPKKKPVAKKKKISAKDLKKGSSQETIGERISRLEQNAQDSAVGEEHQKTTQYQETTSGRDAVTGENLSGAEQKRRFLLRKKGISTEAFKKGSSVGGAENVAPNNEVTDLAKRQAAGDLPQAVTEPPAQPEAQQPQLDGVKGSQESPMLEGIKSPLKAIAESIDRIKDSLTGQSKVQEDAVEDRRKSDEEKEAKKREGGLEKFLGPVKSAGAKVLKPFKSMLSQVFDFLTTIFFGRIAMKLFDWFANPANTDKITSIFKFIADWWPVLLAGIMAFLPGLLGPVGMIAGTIALLAWGIPKIIDAVKSIFGFGKDIDKELKSGSDTFNKDIESAGKDAEKKLEPGSEEDSPAGVTGDPSDSSTPAELSGVQKSQQDTQALAGGGPVEKKKEEGGQVEGEKGKDKVPAMLTDGEFVMSKGAVQQYGADTLAGMNAAAGGTNKPSVSKGVSRYSGGGPVGQMPSQSSVSDGVAGSSGSIGSSGSSGSDGAAGSDGASGVGAAGSDGASGSDGSAGSDGASSSSGGIFGAVKGVFGKATQLFNPQIMIVKNLIGGIREMVTKGHETMHKAMGAGKLQKHLSGHAKEEKKHKLIHKRIMKTARLGSRRPSAPEGTGKPGRMVRFGMNKLAGGLDKLTGDRFDFDKRGGPVISKNQKGREEIKPPNKPKSTQAIASQMESASQDSSTPTNPALGIPNFDAGMMRSQSKIRTLGVSV